MTKSIEKDLLKADAYPEQTKGVELVQTHISLIFITDEYVYKVKKPVNFGFLDFSTLEKRLFFCRKEVELNRRLSPDIYLGVSRVTDEGDRLVIEGKGKTVEYAVKMKKISKGSSMLNLLEEGKLTTELLDRVAKKVADFHRVAGGRAVQHGRELRPDREVHWEIDNKTAVREHKTLHQRVLRKEERSLRKKNPGAEDQGLPRRPAHAARVLRRRNNHIRLHRIQ
jgi:aminoglycoside phosphotransferase family enzyme